MRFRGGKIDMGSPHWILIVECEISLKSWK